MISINRIISNSKGFLKMKKIESIDIHEGDTMYMTMSVQRFTIILNYLPTVRLKT